MKYIVSPAPEEALEALHDGISRTKKQMVTIVGDCKVDYSGRARSFLDYGERLVIVKADGTVMVHGNEKREPLNWQPPGTKVKYAINGGLTIEAKRTSPPEFVACSAKTKTAPQWSSRSSARRSRTTPSTSSRHTWSTSRRKTTKRRSGEYFAPRESPKWQKHS